MQLLRLSQTYLVGLQIVVNVWNIQLQRVNLSCACAASERPPVWFVYCCAVRSLQSVTLIQLTLPGIDPPVIHCNAGSFDSPNVHVSERLAR